MLTWTASPDNARVTTASRRGWLRAGWLGLGSLGLADLLAARARGEAPGIVRPGKSVVFLFCSGGPSQIETFDPKPNAAAEVRSQTGWLQSNVPGMEFGGTFPEIGRAHV